MKLPTALAVAFATLAFAGSSLAAPVDDLITKEKCSKCHTATTTKKGPSWASIATKYKADAEARNKIFLQLKNGGKVGDEDDHKKVVASDADIKAIVEVVLSSK